MVDITFSFGERATTAAVDATITIDAKLHVCLMQLAPAMPAIENDAARPVAVEALRHLLVGGGDHDSPVLREMIPGNEPAMIVLPEYALGSGDWSAVNAAIRTIDRPLIVIAGFGATPGHVVLEWAAVAAEKNETVRHLAWDQANNPISSARRLNGGWCWVHHPGDTHCITYLKTVAEQNVEAVQLADLQFGRTVTHLRFNDVDLFPLICADMLQLAANHPDSAQARVREALQTMPTDRPAMVIGSLLQHGYNANWQRAVDSFVTHVLGGRPGLVTLCNVALDKPVAAEDQDQWRSLTGVFGRWDELTKGQANLPCGRRVTTTGIVGAVIRQAEPVVTSGTVDWGPYGPVDGKFIWHADMLCPIGHCGLVAPVKRPPAQHACEIIRFLHRHPLEPGWSPRIATGTKGIASHFFGGGMPTADRVLNALLNGVGSDVADPDRLHEEDIVPAAVAGLHSLATMSTIEGVGWQPLTEYSGQLRLAEQNRNILVWRDAKRTAGQMRAMLGSWCLEPGDHPDLIVLGASRFGDMQEGIVSDARRDDVSVPPPASAVPEAGGSLAADGVDITAPRARRRVASISLAMVSTIYADYEEGVDDAPLVQALFDRIEAYFPQATAE